MMLRRLKQQISALRWGLAERMWRRKLHRLFSVMIISATIVAAIEEGRGIYENIRKFIRYLLASNVGEILTMFFAMMAGLPLPLVPIQILWVNLGDRWTSCDGAWVSIKQKKI